MTPTLYIDQNGNEASALADDDALSAIIDGTMVVRAALPADEALDRTTCYRIHIEVSE